jgi:hypothetical protein
VRRGESQVEGGRKVGNEMKRSKAIPLTNTLTE